MAQTGCVPNPLWMTQSLTAPLLSMTPRQQENVGYSVQLPKAGAAPSHGCHHVTGDGNQHQGMAWPTERHLRWPLSSCWISLSLWTREQPETQLLSVSS